MTPPIVTLLPKPRPVSPRFEPRPAPPAAVYVLTQLSDGRLSLLRSTIPATPVAWSKRHNTPHNNHFTCCSPPPNAPPPFNTPLSPPTELLSKHTRSSQSCLLCCSIYGQMRRLDTREPNTTFTANCSGMMKWPIWCGCTVCRTASFVVRFRQIHHGHKISKPLVQ